MIPAIGGERTGSTIRPPTAGLEMMANIEDETLAVRFFLPFVN
jgi:hypothetical protein